jgi:hypothetical protein
VEIALASLHLCSLSPIEDHISLLLVSRAAAILAPEILARLDRLNGGELRNCLLHALDARSAHSLACSSALMAGRLANHSLNHSVLLQE